MKQKILAQLHRAMLTDPQVAELMRLLGNERINITGPSEPAIAMVDSLLASERPLVVLTADILRARRLLADLQALTDLPAAVLPIREWLLTDVFAASREKDYQRATVLYAWLTGALRVLIVPVDCLSERMPSPERFLRDDIRLEVGSDYDFDDLIARLQGSGYSRTERIDAAGMFAVRGDIIDIGVQQLDGFHALRCSFFDTELDDLREFDIDSQRSLFSLEAVKIPPALEFYPDTAERLDWADAIRERGRESRIDAEKRGAARDVALVCEEIAARDAEALENHMTFPKDRWYGVCEQTEATLFDYMTYRDHAVAALEEMVQIKTRLDARQMDFQGQVSRHVELGRMLPESADSVVPAVEAMKGIGKTFSLTFAQIARSGNGLTDAEAIMLHSHAADRYRSREDMLAEDLKRWRDQDYTSIVFCGSESRAEKLTYFLADHETAAVLSPADFANGVIWPDARLAVIGSGDIFGTEQKRKRKKRRMGAAIDFFGDLKEGEAVVHEVHGIGLYQGLKTLDTSSGKREYLQIAYANDDMLYIPTDQIDQIRKYVSADQKKPKLTRLDGNEWERLKRRAEESIRQLATDLVSLYATRREIRGHEFAPDTVWQEEFEEAFPFEETPDQLQAMTEIKGDMESPKVMDRLLCGDVGFGKTELAFRALFKAVMDGKQGAFLAPTTVLTQQHYDNFKERVGNFPLRVKMLSRFVPEKEKKAILKGLANGEVDVVIGTHSLLSKQVKFKNLGLLVVDEEQRFGVDHKEGIKERYPGVDVLTLTATPIPRTLHMSLSGIRDISTLETGPEDRRSIQTYVTEFDPELVREAILREIHRGGQVFYLFNNTHKIAAKAEWLRELIPGARITYAHGRMGERNLEKAIDSFISGDQDILVCTTIIESGIDMPNVNTIIVEDADRLGLAQLYQIRGRVGRSGRQAYAYITYDPGKMINEDAVKRLAAIRDFTELGSGLKIAMRDLEVRGAGNLLGAEQHGHLDAIGYELYCKMLDRNIRELQGEPQPLPKEPAVLDITIDARIPAGYVESEGERMDIYRKLAEIRGKDDYLDMLDEWIDRYGEPPKETIALADIALIRNIATAVGIVEIKPQGDDYIAYFSEDRPVDMEKISRVFATNNNAYLHMSRRPSLVIKQAPDDPFELTTYLRKLFEQMLDASADDKKA